MTTRQVDVTVLGDWLKMNSVTVDNSDKGLMPFDMDGANYFHVIREHPGKKSAQWKRVAAALFDSHASCGQLLAQQINLTIRDMDDYGYIRQSASRSYTQKMLIPPHPAGLW